MNKKMYIYWKSILNFMISFFLLFKLYVLFKCSHILTTKQFSSRFWSLDSLLHYTIQKLSCSYEIFPRNFHWISMQNNLWFQWNTNFDKQANKFFLSQSINTLYMMLSSTTLKNYTKASLAVAEAGTTWGK